MCQLEDYYSSRIFLSNRKRHSLLSHREEPIEVGINAVGDGLEGLGVVAELAGVSIDDEQGAFIRVYPFFVEVVEALQIVDLDALLVTASAFLYLIYEVGDTGADVNHQVGELYQGHHEVEEFAVVIEVAVAHQSFVVQIGSKDAGILEDGAVLNDVVLRLGDFHNVAEAFVEEIYLQVERPSCHIGVVVLKIGIVIDRLEAWRPSVAFGEHLGQCGLSTSDVSGNGDMHGVRL